MSWLASLQQIDFFINRGLHLHGVNTEPVEVLLAITGNHHEMSKVWSQSLRKYAPA
jgi:hypothetical protein